MSMYLSYYDTYWDDSIIPEQCERHVTFTSDTPSDYDFELIPFGTESPGVRSEQFSEVSDLDMSDYMEFVIDEWASICNVVSSQTYFASVSLHSTAYPYWDDYYDIREFDIPNPLRGIGTMHPEDYGFANAYPNAGEITQSHVTSEGSVFETARYRAKSDGSMLILSPMRRWHDRAYIEFRFRTGLRRIDIELSHCRNPFLEGLTADTGAAYIEYSAGDHFVKCFDLLAPSTDLPISWSAMRTYNVTFTVPVYIFRIVAEMNDPSVNDTDRGRICVGDMTPYEDPDSMQLSGSELPYYPTEWWRTEIRNNTNCYSYAINAKHNPNGANECMVPGQSVGVPDLFPEEFEDVNLLLSLIRQDAMSYGFGFYEIDRNSACSSGRYKVALFIDPYTGDPGDASGMHWYRQNADGTWSHKNGSTDPLAEDWYGYTIYDPCDCFRGEYTGTNGLWYSDLVGYFEITPLNC